MQIREKTIASESKKIQKTREKLKKKWESQQEKITPEALKETVEKIHKWIADQANLRAMIPGKQVRLFNQNQNSAKLSKKVETIAEKLRCPYGSIPEESPPEI